MSFREIVRFSVSSHCGTQKSFEYWHQQPHGGQLTKQTSKTVSVIASRCLKVILPLAGYKTNKVCWNTFSLYLYFDLIGLKVIRSLNESGFRSPEDGEEINKSVKKKMLKVICVALIVALGCELSDGKLRRSSFALSWSLHQEKNSLAEKLDEEIDPNPLWSSARRRIFGVAQAKNKSLHENNIFFHFQMRKNALKENDEDKSSTRDGDKRRMQKPK